MNLNQLLDLIACFRKSEEDLGIQQFHKGMFPGGDDGVVYADWTGAAIPPNHLILDHSEFMVNTRLGNPHSHHTSSQRAMKLALEARAAVLKFLNADPEEYDVMFTSNASQAILVLQHYLWGGGELLLTADNHNTMNGLREIARREGAEVRYSPLNSDLTLNEADLLHKLRHPRRNQNRLFGFPAKSNYSGVEHPLKWVQTAQEYGWDVVLDAAAYLANGMLDLSQVKPEFVPMSFYKIFGFPTGIGALVVKKSVFERMHKKWFAGGTILLVSVMADFYALEPPSHARYEDGTINFQMLPAIKRGLDWVSSIGNRKVHAVGLATTLYDELSRLDVNGNRFMIHSPRGADMVTFSVVNKHGEHVNAWLVEKDANNHGIQFRSGCFCNPGANEATMGYTVDHFERVYNDGATADDFTLDKLREHSGGKPIGALRASFGYANDVSDIHRIVGWAKEYLGRI